MRTVERKVSVFGGRTSISAANANERCANKTINGDGIRHRIRQLVVTVLVLTGLIGGAGVVTAFPAQASAYGVALFGGWNVTGIGWVPKGELEHGVSGSGLRIDREYSEFNAVAPICNWRIAYRWYDTSGTQYYSYKGTVHWGCNVWGHGDSLYNGVARPGHVCASLYSNGTWIPNAKQCHNISR